MFESNDIQMLICSFENKDVHAIDYATGDIVFEFVFKDDTILTGGANSQKALPDYHAEHTMNFSSLSKRHAS